MLSLFTKEHPLKIAKSKPTIVCFPLPAFDTSDLEGVRNVFRPVASQAWLEKKEEDFAPAFVSVGWRENVLLVFAELIDFEIFSETTSLNQRAWELGDTFEMFLQPVGQSTYFEFQVTPNNQRVQLLFTDSSVVEKVRKSKSTESVCINGEAFFFRTWIKTERKCWYVYAEINMKDFVRQVGSLQGSQWRFSFSRYDYTRGRKQPVISSTSRHGEPDFHRQDEWDIMSFES
jgi:hypothetical protein